MPKRELSVDLCRAAAAWPVIWIHAGFLASGNLDALLHPLANLAVPVFLAISIKFTEQAFVEGITYRVYLRKRVLRLAVLYAVWSLIYFILKLPEAKITSVKILAVSLMGFGWSGQYFLLVLLQAAVLYPVFRNVAKYGIWILWVVGVTSSVVLLALEHFAHWNGNGTKLLILPWLPYVAMGMTAARNSQDKAHAWLFGLGVFVPLVTGLVLWTRVFAFPSWIDSIGYFNAVTYLAVSLIMSNYRALEPLIGRWGPRRKNLVVYVANGSLAIYLLNPLFVFYLFASHARLLDFLSASGARLTWTVLIGISALLLGSMLRHIRLSWMIS